MSKKHNNSPLEEYILLSPAPVDLATKLAHTLLNLSDKVSTKDLKTCFVWIILTYKSVMDTDRIFGMDTEKRPRRSGMISDDNHFGR